jgi:hypothetical protein
VEVLVVRNPKAGITNFGDVPDGLRVYDAPDDGPGFLAALLTNPFGIVGRVQKAHESVLSDGRVAECITAEINRPGTCDLPRAESDPTPGFPLLTPFLPTRLVL